MTITRLWQSGFELANNSMDAGPNVVFTGAMAYTTGTVRTGVRALLMGTSRFDFYYDLGGGNGISQVRVNCQFYWDGGTDGFGNPELFWSRSGGIERIRVQYVIGTDQWKILSGDPPVTLTDNIAPLTLGWNRVCCDIKLHATTGWVYLFLNDVQIIGFDGDTSAGGTTAEHWGIGPITGINKWGSGEVIDDVTIENTVGEASPADSEDRRYHLMVPDGAGNYTNWTPSAGSNFENVDEIPPDGDTTYNEANVNGTKDSYSVADYAVPSGRKVDALIATAVVRKVNSLHTVQLGLFSRENGVDNSSGGKSITSVFETYFHRITTAPDGGTIFQSVVDNIEPGVEIVVP